MAKNRKIPFGYMMQNGEITTNPKEVLAVVTIFRSYLNGESLVDISKAMEVPYNEGVAWNKNMVKRIIENEKYLGTDKYPQLIDEDTFHRANATRVAKATSLCVISDELYQIRELTFCKECGNRMFRKVGNTRSEKWDCCRKECYPLDYRLTDQMLIGAILNVLNSVIANPSLLECNSESSAYTPSGEVIRQQNEIRHMMDAAQLDYDRTKSEILRLVQMQYDCCTYSDKPQQTELLRSLLVGHEQLNSLDIGLLRSCVSRIWVSHFCTIEIELINGTIIHNITERSASHGNGNECNEIPAKPQTASNRNQYKQLRVAAYCRVSTEQEEQQNSYQVQIEYYTDLIHSKKEWTLAGIFADEGISGTQTKKRTEFNRMIRMCKQKKIDLILTKSISRFARNTVDCLEYVRILKELGIGVIFEKENINTLTMTSEFMIALYGSFAQAESESISKNVSLGVQMAMREGKVRYSYKHWLGYCKGENGKPVIIPEEAEMIRKVYELFLDGHSMAAVAEMMMVHSTDKIEWHRETIRRILTNEKYTGDCLLQKTFTADCITHKAVKNNGERAMYLVSDCHPAIIDRDTFNLVQQEIARRTSKRKVSTKTVTEQGKYSSKYALTDLMICGECGTPYRRVVWRQHGTKNPVWRCISRLDHGGKYCKSSPTIHEEPLHRAIIQAVNEFYDCGDDVAKILKANVKSVLAGMEQSEINKIKNRLKEIDKARNDMISLITSGSCDEDTLDAEFAKLYEEETHLSGKLLSLKAQCKVSDDTKDKIESTIAEIENSRFQLEAFDDVLIRKLIECVKVISKTEIIIIFKGGYEVKAEVEKK